MIDCHVHAVPALSWFTRQRAPLAAALLERIPGVNGVPITSGSRPTMTVTRLASLRRRYPDSKALDAGEKWASLFGTALLATGMASIHSLRDSMDRHGVEQSVVIAGPPLIPNDWLLGAAKDALGDRLIPVAWLPDLPLSTTDPERWERGFEELAARGARGFKIHPGLLGVPPEHPAIAALFRVAERAGCFVILHTGCFHVFAYKDTRPEASHPHSFEAYFDRHRTVPVCLAHMNRDRPEGAWEMMERYDQVWADTSWQDQDTVRRCVERCGSERVLLGSDWPLLHPDLQGESIAILREAVGEEMAEKISTENASRFLGAAESSERRHER